MKMNNLGNLVAGLWLALASCGGRDGWYIPADAGIEDHQEDVLQAEEQPDYPLAELNCDARNRRNLCVYQTMLGRDVTWDASPSDAGPGRKIVQYTIHQNVSLDGLNAETPNGLPARHVSSEPIITGRYTRTTDAHGYSLNYNLSYNEGAPNSVEGGFHGLLIVTDDLGREGRRWFRALVARNAYCEVNADVDCPWE